MITYGVGILRLNNGMERDGYGVERGEVWGQSGDNGMACEWRALEEGRTRGSLGV